MDAPARLPADVIRQVLADEEACLAVFSKWRWPNGFVCPRCHGRDGRRISRRPAWRCFACGHHARVTAGTALHRSRLPLSAWLAALILVGDRKQSVSALQLQIDLRFGCYRTAWHMLHIIRDVMEDTVRLHRGLIEFALTRLGPRDVREPTGDEGTLLALAVERLETVEPGGALLPFSRIKIATFPPSTSWLEVKLVLAPNTLA